MTIQELITLVKSTHFEDLQQIQLIEDFLDKSKLTELHDIAVIESEASYEDDDYIDSDFQAYKDDQGRNVPKNTKIGVELRIGNDNELVLFKGVSF